VAQVKRLAAALVAIPLAAGCGAYGTGLPNGDTVEQTYQVYLIVGGSSKSKRILIEFFNVPKEHSQRYQIGQFQTYHFPLKSGQGVKITVFNSQQTDFVSCRIRTEPETAEIYTTDTHTARCYKKMP
jgi:hypothetical protein